MKRTSKLLVLLAALVMVCVLALTSCGEQPITYNLDGGTNSASAPVEYKPGEALDLGSVVPTKTGYTFDGWYTDAAFTTKAQITAETEGAITLYAKWTANKYAVTFETNGGTLTGAPTEYTYAEGLDLGEIVPTKANYAFGGWYADEALTETAEITATTIDAVTVYAKWTPVDYDITVDLDGGALANVPTKYTYSVGLNLGDYNPSKQHYNFTGWTKDGVAITEITITDSGNVTIVATWELKDYTITYVIGDDATHDGAIGSYNFGDAIAIADIAVPKRENFAFGGWYADAEYTTAAADITAESFGDVTLYAKWIPVFAITFEKDGGRFDKNATVPEYGVVGEAIDLSTLALTKRGYNFLGWFTDEACTNKVTEIPATQTEAITLYAKFELATYTITYVYGEGVTLPDDAPTKYTYGEGVATLPTPIAEKYEFAGWFADETYQTPVTSITVSNASDVVLYAKMTPKSYAINYVLGGPDNKASMPENTDTRYYATIGIEALPTPTVGNAQYEFLGWYEDEARTQPISSIAADREGDVTVYAKFVATFINNDGSDKTGFGGTALGSSKEGCSVDYLTDENGEKYIAWTVGTKDPQLDISASGLYKYLAATGDTAVSYKITFAKEADAPCAELEGRVKYYKIAAKNGALTKNYGNNLILFRTTSDGAIKLNNNASLVVGHITTEPQTFYFVIDFVSGTIKAYNEYGVVVAETEPLTVANYINVDDAAATYEIEMVPLAGNQALFGTLDGKSNGSLLSMYECGSKADTKIRVYEAFGQTGNAFEKEPVYKNVTWVGADGAIGADALPEQFVVGLGIKDLPVLEKNRATFIGWFFDADCTQPADSIPYNTEEDITLYAKFGSWAEKAENQGYVEYVAGAGEITDGTVYSIYTEGEEFALPSAKLDGYTFEGWYTSPDFAPESFIGKSIPTTMKGDLVLYAAYTKVYKQADFSESYEITLEDGASMKSKAFGDYTFQQKAGATLKTDVDASGKPYLLYVQGSGDLTIVSNGTHLDVARGPRIMSYTMALAKNEGMDAFAIKGRVRSVFVIDGANKSAELHFMCADNTGVYVGGKPDPNNKIADLTTELVTFRFVINYDTGMIYAVNESGQVLASTTPNVVGGIFNDKYTNAETGEMNLTQFFDDVANYNVFSIYATSNQAGKALRFADMSVCYGNAFVNEYKPYGDIVYNVGEDVVLNKNSELVYAEGIGAVLDNPTREGYVFGGWYADAELEQPITAVPADATGAYNVYAKWIPVYNIEWNLGADDAQLTGAINTYVYGTAIAKDTFAAPTRAGYTFDGWYTDAELTTPASDITETTEGNLVFYAKWSSNEPNEYKQFLDISGEAYPTLDVQRGDADANNEIGEINFQTIGAGTGYKTVTLESGEKYIEWNKGTSNTQLIWTTKDFEGKTENSKVITYQFDLARNGDVAVTALLARLRTEKVGSSRAELHLFNIDNSGVVTLVGAASDAPAICTLGTEFTSFGIVLDFETGMLYAYDAQGTLIAEAAMILPASYNTPEALYAAIEEGFAFYAGASGTGSSLLIKSITGTIGNVYETAE